MNWHARWSLSPEGARLAHAGHLSAPPRDWPRPRPSPRSLGKGTAWRRAPEQEGHRTGQSRFCGGPKADAGSLCHRWGGGPQASFRRAPPWGRVALSPSRSLQELTCLCQLSAPSIWGHSPAAQSLVTATAHPERNPTSDLGLRAQRLVPSPTS